MANKKNAKHAAVRPTSKENTRHSSLLSEKSSFAAIEAYKAARTNLMFTRVGEGCQTIAITSSFEGEGKTVNCANMGISLAQTGQRVLIIDCDLRHPQMRRAFNLPSGKGLSEILAGMADFNELTGKNGLVYSTKYEGLSVLPAGHTPPNPAELLASTRMKELLEHFSEKFDYIMLDTPPVTVVTDAAVLSGYVQGYLMVVRASRTPMDGLKDGVVRLEQVNANILGFILNDASTRSGYYNYSYKRNRYGKYGRYYKRYGYGSESHYSMQEKRDDAESLN